MWYAAIQSAADGKANLRFGCAGSDGVGIAAASMASAGAGVASTSVVSSTGSVVSGFVSGSVSADAATSVMVAPLNATSVTIDPANAGMGTSDSSNHSAALTVMRPSLSLVAEMMLTPTDTSMTPSAASTNASLPKSVRLIFMVASIPSGVSIRSLTMPTGFDGS